MQVDWSEAQRIYDSGKTVPEVCRMLGFGRRSWTTAANRGLVVSRSPEIPLSVILVAGRRTNSVHLKTRLIDEGIFVNRCACCDLPPEWNGQTLIMQLDHKNGDAEDNRIENLWLLCPNCHSQTDTFCGKNKKRDVA